MLTPTIPHHCIYSSGSTPDAISRYSELISAGFPSIKVFTTDIRPPEGRVNTLTPIGKIDTGRLADVMGQIARHGGVLAVHGEDDELVMYNYLLAQQRGLWDWYNVHEIHSKLVEDLAFQQVIRLARRTETGVYFVHVTAKDGLDAISEARADGLPVYGEVLTLALSFNCDNYKESDGMKYHTYPSLKYEDDRTHLWDGLLRRDLSFTATDSSFTTYLDKIAGRNVVDVRGGNIGIEIRMGVNYTEAVVRRGVSLEQYANITSTNAAKMLGLYPRKGVIAAGSDADITIIDPSIKKPLAMADLHLRDYSPWEGWDIEGWPTTVMLRGKVMVDGGELLGTPDDGQLIPRKIDQVGLEPSGVLGKTTPTPSDSTGGTLAFGFFGELLPEPTLTWAVSRVLMQYRWHEPDLRKMLDGPGGWVIKSIAVIIGFPVVAGGNCGSRCSPVYSPWSLNTIGRNLGTH